MDHVASIHRALASIVIAVEEIRTAAVAHSGAAVSLTTHESAVCRLVAYGLSSAVIANNLSISEQAVQSNIYSALTKMYNARKD
jgi:DNA-binding NarL/FixJ family response regulator